MYLLRRSLRAVVQWIYLRFTFTWSQSFLAIMFRVPLIFDRRSFPGHNA